MSAESKKKRGESGLSNAKTIPFRYHGGSVDRPAYQIPEVRMARTMRPSNHKNTSKYMTGMLGGLAASLSGFRFPGDTDFHKAIIASK